MQVASSLAAARMTGRVWSTVHVTDELRPGDHIAFNTGALYYYQHAIVTAVDGTLLISFFLHLGFLAYMHAGQFFFSGKGCETFLPLK